MADPKDIKQLPGFDADFSPSNEQNQKAAKARNLKYDPQSQCYRDEDGALVRDKFGQPL